MKENLTLGDKHKMQYTYDVLLNGILEVYVILLSNILLTNKFNNI